ncbi:MULTISPECIES: hypothetical protein [unclassified Marinobacterium]|jgi:hypothetical protein|uniref:hypothetical protein n=1 Tax=unclassified Marinobacterium TaxID=2644139 RepID=UPI0015686B8F|nr:MULTISPECIES: hypothetical protein [unclassified Marinobacterium]NRP27579.1 hypothetical protein [Marinobacterium sp. xm-d-420]NRP47882.1 hypothetical protein [Marinobacterium sp. xm-d-543]NRQ24121.1 hypothetical protein [Marinobacterium sp. xm-m-312]
MKKILAIAIATAISAPAMADLTIGGKLSMDYISNDQGATTSNDIQRDDVIINIKASSTTDAGLNVSGVISTENDFAAPTVAYVRLDNGTIGFQMGKFANPAGGADVSISSDSDAFSNGDTAAASRANLGHFTDEIDNAAAVTFASNGVSAAVAVTQAGVTDSSVFALGYAAGDFAVNVGYESTDGYDVTGLRGSYTMGDLKVDAFKVETAYAASADVSTLGLEVNYTMGATSLRAILAEDDYGTTSGDLTMVGVTQNLGGGVKAYAEYATYAEDAVADKTITTLGVAYSF